MGDFDNFITFSDFINSNGMLGSEFSDKLSYLYEFTKTFDELNAEQLKTENNNDVIEREDLLKILSTKTTDQLRMVVHVLEQIENENNK